MNIPAPLADAGVEFLVSLIIRAKTGGDKDKEAARATEGLAIIAALRQLASGDAANGIVALQAAFDSAVHLDPGESLALQSLVSWSSARLSTLLAVAGSSVVGQLALDITGHVLNAATKACDAYLPKPAA
jgi:hypothetical protein